MTFSACFLKKPRMTSPGMTSPRLQPSPLDSRLFAQLVIAWEVLQLPLRISQFFVVLQTASQVGPELPVAKTEFLALSSGGSAALVSREVESRIQV